MGDDNQQPRRTMGDYCKRTDTDQISLGFRPANPMNFDIKGNMLAGLRENQFDGRANKDMWDHLTQFSETFQIQKVSKNVTEDQKTLRLFALNSPSRIGLLNSTVSNGKGFVPNFSLFGWSDASSCSFGVCMNGYNFSFKVMVLKFEVHRGEYCSQQFLCDSSLVPSYNVLRMISPIGVFEDSSKLAKGPPHKVLVADPFVDACFRTGPRTLCWRNYHRRLGLLRPRIGRFG
ncbi:hypothetical protein TSUD_348420 [Trifolium subterraneum]|nr:hypothetical protein TSUD_348420 [Trifolium subterraneum]